MMMAISTDTLPTEAHHGDAGDLLLTVKEACDWASRRLGRRVSPSNIMYLVNYGRVANAGGNGRVMIHLSELSTYYDSRGTSPESPNRPNNGDVGLNWSLSFDEYRESERTKHVHRLHPYKGKFIPQLVEYFLDRHTDQFKREAWFNSGDTVLDPFCGSGTTLVQANELGIHAIGVDISEFNSWISNAKVDHYDIGRIQEDAAEITSKLKSQLRSTLVFEFNEAYSQWLSDFNHKHFPSPDFRRQVRHGAIDEMIVAKERLPEIVEAYRQSARSFGVGVGLGDRAGSFLEGWYLEPVRAQLQLLKSAIEELGDVRSRQLLNLVLCRTARTCRATTHADLATLVEPVSMPYYCRKHSKMCRPLLDATGWWERYANDTIKRVTQFHQLRSDTQQVCITGDARRVDYATALSTASPMLAARSSERQVNGIFTSPPYVGLIDYHEQHAYAYELLGLKRRDRLEIGKKAEGQSRVARGVYVKGVAEVLSQGKAVLDKDANVFVVANDKFGLYPEIAERAGFRIVDEFHRPVLHRTEKDRSPYSETIFHMELV